MSLNGLDPRYIAATDLDPVILDKVTGLPLVGGQVFFWQDLSRLTPQPVYELSGSPPNYTFTQLPNPMILGPKGNFMDNSGADVAVYYYPFLSDGTPSLYYISVFNALGVPQFVRQAWPPIAIEEEVAGQGASDFENAIINGQFGVVNFNTTQNPTAQLVLTIAAGNNQVFNFAPGWQLLVNATGAGSITLNQIAIPGTSNFPGQPPYALQVTSTGAITSLIVQQVLTGNPNIFSQDFQGNGGWVNTSITLAPGIGNDVTVNYVPNGGLVSKTLLTANNVATGVWKTFNASVQLPMGANPNDGPSSSTDIQIVLPVGSTTTFTNFQIVSSFTAFANPAGVAYQEVPLTVQQGELFGFYQPQLNYKPLNSYLVGWDFPKNPGQLGYTFAASGAPSGTNLSAYTWDQTILFQSASKEAGVTRGTSGEYVITASAATQVALIQYLDQAEAQEILSGNVSVNISGYTNQIGGIEGTVSLWVTAGNVGTQMTSNNSIVASLDATGYPTTNNPNAGTWTEITPQLGSAGSAKFMLGTARTSTASKYNNIALNSFGLNNAGAITSATVNQFAIVVGFASLTTSNVITIDSISLVPGDIATRPAPLSIAQTLFNCQQYYEQSYISGVTAAGGTLTNQVITSGAATLVNAVIACQDIARGTGASAGNLYFTASGFTVGFSSQKRTLSPNVILFSPSAGTSGNADGFFNNGSTATAAVPLAVATFWAGGTTGNKNETYFPTGAIINGSLNGAFNIASAWIQYHYYADARLGLVT
jgi:hypothetical protein